MTPHHLAQANWARRIAPLEDPIMRGFVEQLDEINALADASPGFVWRLQTEDGNATDIRVFGDEELIFNMSVWESPEALRAFVYKSGHSQLLRDRGQWFHTPDRTPLVLWWIRAGSLPTLEDAEAKFTHLWEHGPTQEAFSFRESFPAPSPTQHG